MNNAGRIGFLIKGEYEDTASYDFLDVVFYDGASYVARKLTVGNTPARDNEYWQILAEGGTLTDHGNVSDTTVTFEQAENRTNVSSDETMSLFAGKVAKYFADLKDLAFTGEFDDLTNVPQNTSEKAGMIPSSNGRANKVWKTDADGNPSWSPYVEEMVGATEENSGKAGLVPVPKVSDFGGFLSADGSWTKLGDAAYANVENNAETTEEGGLLDARMGPVFQEQLDALNLFRDFILAAPNKNAIVRCKSLGASVTPEQIAAIRDGSFKDLFLGDYWTINGVNWRIWDFNYWLHCGDTAFEKNHAVILPDKNLYSQRMNASNTTAGGYIGSEMYKSGLAAAKTAVANAFGSYVLSHRELLTNAVANGIATAGAWVDSTVELPNEVMMYGSYIFTPANNGSTIPYDYTINKSQLALANLRHDFITTRENYWLRDVVSASGFAIVTNTGYSASAGASTSLGVRPVFCIG